MADETKYISKLTLPGGVTVEVKDKVAREAIAHGVRLLGITSTFIEDGASTQEVQIGNDTVTATNGNMVIYGDKEFIYIEEDLQWHEFGDLLGVSGLGQLALKDSAEGDFTPSGAVSKPDIDVSLTTTQIKQVITDGSVTPGAAASCTLPQLQFSYDSDENELTMSWTAGSFQANTPTLVTLPTSGGVNMVTGVSAELHEAPEFTGTEGTVTVS